MKLRALGILVLVISLHGLHAETIEQIQNVLISKGIYISDGEALTDFLSVAWDEGDELGKGVLIDRYNPCSGIRYWVLNEEKEKVLSSQVYYTRQAEIEILESDNLVFRNSVYIPSSSKIYGRGASTITFENNAGFVTCPDSSRIELSNFTLKMNGGGTAIQLGSNLDPHASDLSYTHLLKDLIIDYRGNYHSSLTNAIFIRSGQHLVIRNLELYGTPFVNGTGLLVDGGDVYVYGARIWGFGIGVKVVNSNYFTPKSSSKPIEAKKHVGIFDSKIWGFGQYGILFDSASGNSVMRSEIIAPNQNQIGMAFKNESRNNVIYDSVVRFGSSQKFYAAYHYSGSNQNYLINTAYEGALNDGFIVE